MARWSAKRGWAESERGTSLTDYEALSPDA